MSHEGESSATDDLVAVGRYSTAPEAFMAANRLDSEGIDSTLEDLEFVTIDWQLGQAAGGVKLLVQREDAERAQAVLKDAAKKETDSEGDESTQDHGRAVVRRAMWSTVFGMSFPPLLVYAAILLRRAGRMYRDGQLDEPLRRRIVFTKIMLWSYTVFLFIVIAGTIWVRMKES